MRCASSPSKPWQPGPRPTAASGALLIELLCALAIVALAAAAVTPASALLDRVRTEAAAAELEASLRFARTFARQSQLATIVCARGAAGCDREHRWQLGWIVASLGADGRTLAIVSSHPPLAPQIAVRGGGLQPGPAVALRFDPRGTLAAGGPYATSASFLLCPAAKLPDCRTGRRLVVVHGGQIVVGPAFTPPRS